MKRVSVYFNMKKTAHVVWFTDVDKDDIGLVGGKGANLGEMTKAGFPVPPGFIVTAQAYFHFLEEADIREAMREALVGLDVNDSKKLEMAARKVRTLITNSKFPKDIAHDVIRAYFKLETKFMKHPLVAVRSSATAEDLPTASFAGQQATFLDVKGEANLLEKIKEAWASLFTARAVFYRATNKFDHFKVGIAVPVQLMVESDTSGVMFTIDPVTNDKKKIIVEGILGLGEMIVQGSVTPDHFEIDKKSLEILNKNVHTQDKIMERRGGKTTVKPLSKARGSKQKISDKEAVEIAKIGKQLERHYFFPQDVEWAIDKGTVYIVQTRPVTTTGGQTTTEHVSVKKDVILKGDPASPGMAAGPVKIITSAKEIGKIVSGNILVAPMTNPDFVPAMKKAVAIVTERGGRTSHAAIVSRELGIPAVVGAAGATKTLNDNLVITVNGSAGEVYKGSIVPSNSQKSKAPQAPKEKIKTATRVYMNLAEAGRAKELSKLDVDGVGLLRAEFMMAAIGTHPKKMLKDGKRGDFVKILSTDIAKITGAFSPRPVVYRTSDFKTNEYRHLKGGAAYEPEEPNPMLGYRGAARYAADPEVFAMELDAIKHVRNKLGHRNLWVMLPFVRTPEELSAVKKLIAQAGLTRSATFKLWMMTEIPTNVIRINDFLDVGIDGVSIGSNDLTMLTLGTDRDNSDVAHDFSELDPAVLWSLERVIKACAKRGVTSSICGQAPSDYPELVEKLVSWGITSVSVNSDAAYAVRHTVADAEEKLVWRK